LSADVFDVQGELVLDGQTAAAGDLGQAGQAGLDEQSLTLEGVPFGDLGDVERSRPDQAHVADKHVPKLGQLVQRVFAEESAQAGQAGVLAGLGAVAIRVHIGTHGAELVEGEGAAIPAGPLLTEEARAGACQADGQGDDQQHRPEDRQGQARDQQIEPALGGPIHGRAVRLDRRCWGIGMFVYRTIHRRRDSIRVV